MWELDHKECWALKNWCFWTVALENTLESPLGYKEIKPVNYKVNQPWIFIGRTDAETPVLWPLMWRALEKILMLGKIESRRRRGWQRVRWLDVITEWVNMSLTKLWVIMKDRKAWCAAVPGVTKSWTWLSDWKMKLQEAIELAHVYNSWWVAERDVSLPISDIMVSWIKFIPSCPFY